MRRGITVGAILAALAVWAGTARAHGVTQVIARTGDAAPDGDGTLSEFRYVRLNNAGQVAFAAALDASAETNGGIYLGTTQGLTQLVREGQTRPDGGGVFSLTPSYSYGFFFNEAGQVGFGENAFSSDHTLLASGVYRASAAGVTQIAFGEQAAPDENGSFAEVYAAGMNNAGEIVLARWLTGPSGGDVDSGAIFRGSGGALTEIVGNGQTTPRGDGTFSFGNLVAVPVMDDSGNVYFKSDIMYPSGEKVSALGAGIWMGSGGAISEVALHGQEVPAGSGRFLGNCGGYYANMEARGGKLGFYGWAKDATGTITGDGIFVATEEGITRLMGRGDAAPDGNGTFATSMTLWAAAGEMDMNDAGQIALPGDLVGTSGTLDRMGVFRADEGGVVTIARGGQFVPDGNGQYATFFARPLINESGLVVFGAKLSGTGGSAAGIFIGDGQEVVEVARGTEATFIHGTYDDNRFSLSLNDYGQVAYLAESEGLGDGVHLFTPELRWRSPESGAWEENSKWTLGLTPAAVHPVVIGGDAAVTVAGPVGDVTVRSLKVGGGAAEATLELGEGVLTTLEGLTVATNGKLHGGGTIGGDYQQESGGELEVAIGALSEVLTISGEASLGGLLGIEYAAGFWPGGPGDYQIMTFGASTGATFEGLELPGLAKTLAMFERYHEQDVTVRVMWRGDMNDDEQVNALDIEGLVAAMTDPAGYAAGHPEVDGEAVGDANGDGEVNALDIEGFVRLLTATTIVPGDFNGDGGTNALDVAAFVLAITDAAGYAGQYAAVDAGLVEPNGDGVINALDIQAFVALVTGGGMGGGAVVPEPATAGVMLVLAAVVGCRRRNPLIR